jgi:acyl-CoA-binding protein
VPDLIDEFERAAAAAKGLGQRPDNDTLLRLYALYKQGREGDASDIDRPGFFDFIGTAKLEAWRALHGMPREQAMSAYVALVRELGAEF